jgi:hypothetical protein
MNHAATDPMIVLGGVGCAGLLCLFLISAVILVLLLVRRARRGGASGEGPNGVA